VLDGIRVLDLTDERGNVASMILGGFGAEVIAIEPPGGNPARRLAPFAGDQADPDGSLIHWAANRGKRSVALDVADPRFLDLVRSADVVFETGELALAGLSYADLEAVNPGLVHVAITAFGSDGPKANWLAPDLVALASSGQLRLCGDPDRAPVRCSVPQGWFHTAADAADAALLALLERQRSGRGQFCDVSAQQSLMQATQSLVLNAPFGVALATRVGGGMQLGPMKVRLVWRCKDGTVSITFIFGASAGPFSERLFEWIHEEGMCDEETLRGTDWIMFASQVHTGERSLEDFERLKEILAAFCLTKTKQELLDAAMARRLLIAPASTIEDVYGFAHFAERGYWDHVDHPELGKTLRYPGPVVQPSTGRLASLGRAPRLGEHTDAVLAELARPAPSTRPAGRASQPVSGSRTRPLVGVKILDFMWSLAGPQITRVMADYGATIVRVESSQKIEMGRTLNPFWGDKVDPEGSGLFGNANAGKLGICLDLNNPATRPVIQDLVRWADVVTESYSPTAMRRWGYDYESLRAINPSLVMLSSSLMGHTGPLASFAGFGNLGAAMAGFYHTTGWADRDCVGPYGGYTDYLSPRLAVASLCAALHRRIETGEGCYLDFAQSEAAMWALGPAFLDYEVNGRVWNRAGNEDRNHCPNVVAPAAGEDRWIAVVCETDDQWRVLCAAPGFGAAAAAWGAAERLARRAEVEALVCGWTAGQDPDVLTEHLQSLGVPAHSLLDAHELWVDPQLRHRGHWVTVDHAIHGEMPIEASRLRLTATPAGPYRAAPTLGQHAGHILEDILGYDEDRITDLAIAEVLE
jgi:crotonobetainyl-CoA:carnitine CoA-transferase CaiB-like acyl-CoA transferase